MKLPWQKFYPGDWLSDPALSLCSPATRGVWKDFTSNMHLANCGQLSGTREQLSRLGRCTIDQVSSAISELRDTRAADVTERNGVVTVVCRRLQREEKARKQGAERVSRYRRNGPVTVDETEVKRSSNGVEVRSQRLEAREEESSEVARARDPEPEPAPEFEVEPPPGFPSSEAEAKIHAAFIGCPEQFAAEVWNEAKGRGYRDRQDHQVRSFRHYLASCWTKKAEYERRQNLQSERKNANHSTGSKPNHRNAGIAGDAAERNRRAIEAAARKNGQ